MSSLQSLKLKRGTFWQILSSRLTLCSTPLRWSRLGPRQGICPYSNPTSKPRPLHHKVDDRDLPLHQAAEVLLGSTLVRRHHSAHPPLSDSSLLKREMPASIRSLPEPLRSGGGFSEVGASSLTGGWRLPSQQLVGLAGSGSGLLGS